ncbi:DUF1501 domain-containing protein [Herminiimonas glaciei]|uniref:DUF1501 domain-containing protein n=1 Tax=Herminiimonas glaciei TaxID=523788 RepID=A0ABW2ID56_9BURK
MMAAAGLLIPVGSSAWAAVGNTQEVNKRKLIVVMLRGAVDGLNVVAPYGDPEYARLRPTIGLAAPGQENGVLDLDGYFGLHPALAPLQTLWEEKKLAFVHASGSPDPTRSHFDAQDYMESGTPGKKSTQDGWLNRMLTVLPGPVSPTRAISIGPVMPRILAGRASATNLPAGDVGSKANLLDKPQVGNAFDQLYQNNEKFGRTYQDAKDAHKEVMSASLENEMQMANNGAPLPNGFPKDAARLAKLMRSDINIQLAFVALGGWDTHANQGNGSGQLANRLAPLGQGLATLAQQLGPVFQDTSIVVMSEFGRTARQNGNGGTDHGHGNVMWLLGGDIAGGKVYGDWQGLSGKSLHEGRDLQVTTDFRAVLAQIAERHLYLNDKQLGQLFPAGPSFGSNINFMRA